MLTLLESQHMQETCRSVGSWEIKNCGNIFISKKMLLLDPIYWLSEHLIKVYRKLKRIHHAC